MGKQLFIIKAGALDYSTTDLADITAGKATIVKVGESKAAKGEISPNDLIQIMAKRTDGSPEITPAFSLSSIVKAKKIEYSEGTQGVATIGFVLPASQKKGDEFIVKVIDASSGKRDLPITSVTVIHKGTDYTKATLVSAMVTAINAKNLGVTASATGAGNDVLTLTADSSLSSFRYAVDGVVANSVISYTVTGIPESGTPEAVAKLEDYLNSFGRGITNKTEYPVRKPVSEVEADGKYTMYVFEMLIDTPNRSGTGYGAKAKYTLYLAEADQDDANHLGEILMSSTVQIPDEA